MTKTKVSADKDVVKRSLRGRVVTVKPKIQKNTKKVHRKEKSVNLAKDRTFSLSPAKFPIVSLVNETFSFSDETQNTNKISPTNNICPPYTEISNECKIPTLNTELPLVEPSCKHAEVDVDAKEESDENKVPLALKKKKAKILSSVAGGDEKTITFGGVDIIPENKTPILKNINLSSIEGSLNKSRVLRVSITRFDAVTPSNISKRRRLQNEPKAAHFSTSENILKIPLIKTPHINKGSKTSLKNKSNIQTPGVQRNVTTNANFCNAKTPNKVTKTSLKNHSLLVQTPGEQLDLTPVVHNVSVLGKESLTVKAVEKSIQKFISNTISEKLALKQGCGDLSQKSANTTSCRRKMPNFAEMHRRNFAQMESLLDHAKRKADRALVLLNTPRSIVNDNNGVGVPNRMYNRFGYKSTHLTDVKRSAELKQIMKAQAPIVISRQEKHIQMSKKVIVQTETTSYKSRNILKGVRLNKRFDLQMKYRNCN